MAARLVGMLPYAFPFALVAVVFYIIALTISRGPMLALAAGFGIAALASPALGVRAALDLDPAWQPQALIALGHPSADYRPFARPTPDLARHFVWR